MTFIEVAEKEINKLQEVLKRKSTPKLKKQIEYLQSLIKVAAKVKTDGT